MKKIHLTIKEWYLFKEAAKFFYEVTFSSKRVIVQADAYQLEQLGY
jgi:hypothetical protein